jgi:hypothetical protein
MCEHVAIEVTGCACRERALIALMRALTRVHENVLCEMMLKFERLLALVAFKWSFF